jgi:hypothetical protein
MAIYVHDILIVWNDAELRERIIDNMKRNLKIMVVRKVKWILGTQVTYEPGAIWLDQEKYLIDVLKRIDMENCKPVACQIEEEQEWRG